MSSSEVSNPEGSASLESETPSSAPTVGQAEAELPMDPEAERIQAVLAAEKRWNKQERDMVYTLKKYGIKNEKSLTKMVEMAETFRILEEWKKASWLLEDVMETRQKMLGKDHPDTVSVMQTLLSIYKIRNRFPMTTDLQIVDFRRDALGLERYNIPAYVFTQDMTGYIAWKNWRHVEAPCKELVESKRKALGKEHPATLAAMNNLALVYSRQERWAEAQTEFENVLEARKRVLGPEHADTLSTLRSLSVTLSRQEKWTETEELERQLLAAFKNVLGDDELTANSMHNLVLMLCRQERWAEAEVQEKELLEMRQRMLGDKHPDTLCVWETLAYTLRLRGLDDEALHIMKQCLEWSTEVLPSNSLELYLRAEAVRKWSPFELHLDFLPDKMDFTKWVIDKWGMSPNRILTYRETTQRFLKYRTR